MVRHLNLTQIYPSAENTLLHAAYFRTLEVAGSLAVQHLNERNSAIISDLPNQMHSCSLHLNFTTLLWESSSSSSSLAQLYRQLDNTLASPNEPQQQQQYRAWVGEVESDTTESLMFLSSAYNIPQISPSATSRLLWNNGPTTFARTIATNEGDVLAAATYLGERLRTSHVLILAMNSPYGIGLAHGVRDACQNQYNIQTETIFIEQDNIQHTLRMAQAQSEIRIIYAILSPLSFEDVMLQALGIGLVSQDYFWIFPGMDSLAPSSGSGRIFLSRNSERSNALARALRGSAVIMPRYPVEDPETFDNLLQDFWMDGHQKEVENLETTPQPPLLGLYSRTTYDAVMALGIAACQHPDNTSGTPSYFDTLLKSNFSGASGFLTFNRDDGTRIAPDLKYAVYNLWGAGEEGTVDIESRWTATVHLGGDVEPRGVVDHASFIYPDGTSTVPPPLQQLEVDTRGHGFGVRMSVWILAGMVLFLSAWFVLWTYRHRNHKLVRAAQPTFLGWLCIGTMMMGAGLIPMTIQESDLACMLGPSLTTIGFTLAMTALSSKSWRIRQLFLLATGMQRVVVQPREVIWPFLLILASDVMFLAGWGFESPLVWTPDAVVSRTDSHGRPLEYHGLCQARIDPDDNGTDLSIVFISGILTVNILGLLLASFQAYAARHVPSDFHDVQSICLCLSFLLQSALLGAPVIWILRPTSSEDKNDGTDIIPLQSTFPSAHLMAVSLLISFFCFSFLLPVFVPKVSIVLGSGDGSHPSSPDTTRLVPATRSAAALSFVSNTLEATQANLANRIHLSMQKYGKFRRASCGPNPRQSNISSGSEAFEVCSATGTTHFNSTRAGAGDSSSVRLDNTSHSKDSNRMTNPPQVVATHSPPSSAVPGLLPHSQLASSVAELKANVRRSRRNSMTNVSDEIKHEGGIANDAATTTTTTRRCFVKNRDPSNLPLNSRTESSDKASFEDGSHHTNSERDHVEIRLSYDDIESGKSKPPLSESSTTVATSGPPPALDPAASSRLSTPNLAVKEEEDISES